MKVICIQPVKSIKTGEVVMFKGSIYTVINVITEKELVIPDWFPKGGRYKEGNWYEFLEIGGHAHEEFFIQLPDDLFQTDEVTKEKVNEIR